MDLSTKLLSIEEKIGRLSPVQKILLGTDGSVTKLLEVVTGEPVTITTRAQKIVPADEKIAEELEVSVGDPVNYRVVELKNHGDSEVLVYAVSHTPVNRLRPSFKADLMQADIPIGRILLRHHLETRREITDAEIIRADAELSTLFQIFRDEPLLSRHYTIINEQKPLIAINEIFPYSHFRDEKCVFVEAPSRLHLGLIDMHGSLGRVDGGIGIAVQHPGILLEARSSDRLEVTGDDPASVAAVRKAAGSVIASKGLAGGARLTIHRSPPRHVGLGSGTALALATAKALTQLSGLQESTANLAQCTGRGGTSGIGTESFDHGGFIIDGGHTFGPGKEKTDFRPSSASVGLSSAPATVRLTFPEDWKILLAIPEIATGANGSEEIDLFTTHCPVPSHEVQQLCHEVLMRMLPGIAERNIEAFGTAVNTIQHIGFKKVELAQQPAFIPELLALMREEGVAGAGLSSFGPTVFAVSDGDLEPVKKASNDYLEAFGGGEVLITSARNAGATVRE